MKARWYLFRFILREAIGVLRGRAERVEIHEEMYSTKIEVFGRGFKEYSTRLHLCSLGDNFEEGGK